MVCPYYTCVLGRANPAPTEDPPLQAYIPFPWGGLGRGLLQKRAPQIGLPFIGGEILFTADFVDIHCIRLLRCETTFCAKMVEALILTFCVQSTM